MDKEIGRQVKHVRAQLSNIFGNQGGDYIKNCPVLRRKNIKTKSSGKLPLTTKVKDRMVLPSISIHRNPLSCTTDREIIRYPPLQRRKSFNKGSFLYKIAVKNTDEHFDWDNIIKTCSRLIKPKYAELSPQQAEMSKLLY